ncbi:hypothetical protein PHJA_002225000 [Phtheirospermum japonicum]|uniref:Smr domain-containing protein n=1 Tax=Phtheirospermum japonicum TaxID=374723 RepID=A0A830CLU9_9LAMI|nr:hypothetical protein PHJA_002225000 [Phtheirospermum japonicum]
MSASTSEKSHILGNRVKAKCTTSGWAALQRQKHQNFESNGDSEAYPLLSCSTTAPRSFFNKNGALLEKPFSSVLVPSVNFPSLVDTTNRYSQPVSHSCEAYQKLKYLHPWADESLIRDVFAGVNNNVDEASSLLEAMLISESENKDAEKVEPSGDDIASSSFNIEGGGGSVGEKDDSFFNKEVPKYDSLPLCASKKSLPIEPEFEWEDDDDIYLIHRKDAIRMTRSASRHSKAANDAYLRGDHTSALQFSLKSQQEWAAAEKLNAKAAKEILNLRNCTNDQWTLDLHGLHAAEAVEALRERLQAVESLVSKNCLATPDDGAYKESGVFTRVKMEKFGRQLPPLARQRQTLLQVITGKGNHSRGAAALPSAIRNFLNENRYHFDETRSGVIMIRPKFRQQ